MLENGYWDINQFDTNKEIGDNFFPIESFKAFSPEELKSKLKENKMEVRFSRSLGSLSHLYLLHLYRQKPNELQSSNIDSSEEFIDLCEKFDIEVMPNGPGTFRRAGVIALAERLLLYR